MGLDQLKDVYDPLSKKKSLAPAPIQSWKDSATVVRLSEYLKLNKGCGIQIINYDGMPALRFSPGLRKVDGRWQIAINAERLLCDAAADVQYLITNGLIDLPSSSSIDADHPSEVPRVLPATPSVRGLSSAMLL
jgi:hypothetical protein